MRRLILVAVAVLAVACGGETLTGPDVVQHRRRPEPTPEAVGNGGGNGCPVEPGPWCEGPLVSKGTPQPSCWRHVTDRPNLCQRTCVRVTGPGQATFSYSAIVSCSATGLH